MTKPKNKDGERLARLRRQAEALIQKSLKAGQEGAKVHTESIQALVHELQVHEVELTMQNDELRRVQQDLETARDRFSMLYDLAPTGYLALDAEGEIREANLTAAKILDADRKDVIHSKFYRYIATPDRDIFYLHQQEAYLSDARQTCELRMIRVDGTTVPVQLETIAIHDHTDFRQECLVSMRDITERLKNEADRTRLAAIVQSSTDAVISRDLEGKILSWNAGAEQMFGYKAEEVVGTKADFLTPPERREEFDRVMERVEKGQVLERFEMERIAKDGRRLLVSATIGPLRDANGRIIGVSEIERDITKQKEAEETVRRSERELTDFFNESPLGVLWVAPDGIILRANRSQLELLERELNEVGGKNITHFFADGELAADLLRRLMQQETVRDYRARLRSRDASLKHVLADANGLWEEGKLVHSRWFVRDITRRVELEREILAISEREQRRIGQDLHDDLGQQLTGIHYLAQALTQQLEPVSRPAALRSRVIARMVQRATVHARELSHGLAPITSEPDGLIVALRQLAARTKQIFRINCRFRCKPAVLIHDPEVGSHLYRIAQEAVNNAIKHGKAKRIDIGLVMNVEKIVLAVSDNGIGMPKRPRKRKGMGLRVMQYRAGVIGGSLIVQRRPDGGTTFVCTIKDGQTGKPKKK